MVKLGAVRIMRTRIGLLVQPKSTRSTIGATLRERAAVQLEIEA